MEKLLRRDHFEEAATIAERWLKTDYLKLHAGEMTAQEVRSVKAVVKAIASQLRDSKPEEYR